MFQDEVKLKLIAGKGGDGCTSFRREKYVPMGGPDGGTGGHGGNIVFTAEKGLKTLVDLKYHKIIKADKGENGKGKNMTGKDAEDVIIKVPLGTTIYDDDTNLILADLTVDKESVIVVHGGRGGKGNKAFATHDKPAPAFSELGEPGEIRYIKCELKLLADVGLIGMPSVGKSSILASVSNSNPKIASYHFTTLNPNLGVVTLKDESTFVLADLPGLIEGASLGVGLGIKFLRHASRCKILAHVIDMSASEGRNPIEDYETIRKEINSYSEKLASKKEVIIANKMDLPSANDNLKLFKKRYPDKQIFEVSALNHTGLNELLEYLKQMLDKILEEKIYNEDEYESTIIYRFKNEKPYTISKEEGIWIIKGKEIEKLFAMTRFDEEEAIDRLMRKLRGMGIDEELERLGAKKGDEIEINNYIFEWKD